LFDDEVAEDHFDVAARVERFGRRDDAREAVSQLVRSEVDLDTPTQVTRNRRPAFGNARRGV
jgi:hypothetical protein